MKQKKEYIKLLGEMYRFRAPGCKACQKACGRGMMVMVCLSRLVGRRKHLTFGVVRIDVEATPVENIMVGLVKRLRDQCLLSNEQAQLELLFVRGGRGGRKRDGTR